MNDLPDLMKGMLLTMPDDVLSPYLPAASPLQGIAFHQFFCVLKDLAVVKYPTHDPGVAMAYFLALHVFKIDRASDITRMRRRISDAEDSAGAARAALGRVSLPSAAAHPAISTAPGPAPLHSPPPSSTGATISSASPQHGGFSQQQQHFMDATGGPLLPLPPSTNYLLALHEAHEHSHLATEAAASSAASVGAAASLAASPEVASTSSASASASGSKSGSGSGRSGWGGGGGGGEDKGSVGSGGGKGGAVSSPSYGTTAPSSPTQSSGGSSGASSPQKRTQPSQTSSPLPLSGSKLKPSPLKASPLRASPLKASPLKASSPPPPADAVEAAPLNDMNGNGNPSAFFMILVFLLPVILAIGYALLQKQQSGGGGGSLGWRT